MGEGRGQLRTGGQARHLGGGFILFGGVAYYPSSISSSVLSKFYITMSKQFLWGENVRGSWGGRKDL